MFDRVSNTPPELVFIYLTIYLFLLTLKGHFSFSNILCVITSYTKKEENVKSFFASFRKTEIILNLQFPFLPSCFKSINATYCGEFP